MVRLTLAALSFILLGSSLGAQVPAGVNELLADSWANRNLESSVPKTELELNYTLDFSNPDFLTREYISTLEMAPISLLHISLDAITSDSSAPFKLGASAVAAVFDRAALKTGHEYGHFSAFSRLGYSDWRYGTRPDRVDEEASPFGIFAGAISGPHVYTNGGDGDLADLDRRFGRSRAYYEFSAAFEAGGLNQNQATLSRYRERLLEGRFGLYDSVPYFGLSVATMFYPGQGDITAYSESLDAYGVHTSEVAARLTSLVRFASGSYLSALYGYLCVFQNQKNHGLFRPFKIQSWSDNSYEFYWPEFESWLSRRGQTVKTMLPIRHIDGGWFTPSVEQSIATGGIATEVGGSLNVPIGRGPLSVKACVFANTEGGEWLEPGVGIKAADWLSFDLTGYWGNGYTFHRDIYGATYDFVDKTESGIRAGVTLFLKF